MTLYVLLTAPMAKHIVTEMSVEKAPDLEWLHIAEKNKLSAQGNDRVKTEAASQLTLPTDFFFHH
jgi:hypothetical protein